MPDNAAALRAAGAGFEPWYRFFPWEDWRDGRPGDPRRGDPAVARAMGGERARASRRAPLGRQERLRLCFGVGGSPWDEEKVLDRYELLYEAGPGRGGAARRPRSRGGRGKVPALGEPMRFDHRRILATAIARLRAKLKYRPVVFELMPDEFTLTELQRTVEAISGRHLHKQNFRRLVETAALVEPTGETSTATGGRPAALFRFRREVCRSARRRACGSAARLSADPLSSLVISRLNFSHRRPTNSGGARLIQRAYSRPCGRRTLALRRRPWNSCCSACWSWRFRSSPLWRWSRPSPSNDRCARSSARLAAPEPRPAAAPVGAAPPPPKPSRRSPLPPARRHLRPTAEPPVAAAAHRPPPPRRTAAAADPATAAGCAASRQISFEERFGTHWTVWVGGVALALGGIFLVNYSIEAGPDRAQRARCSSARCSRPRWSRAGEWTRRKEQIAGFAGLPTRAYSEHPHRRRHHRRLCDRLCRLRALRIPRPGRGLRPARRGRARDARGRACCTARRSRRSAWSAPM